MPNDVWTRLENDNTRIHICVVVVLARGTHIHMCYIYELIYVHMFDNNYVLFTKIYIAMSLILKGSHCTDMNQGK